MWISGTEIIHLPIVVKLKLILLVIDCDWELVTLIPKASRPDQRSGWCTNLGVGQEDTQQSDSFKKKVGNPDQILEIS